MGSADSRALVVVLLAAVILSGCNPSYQAITTQVRLTLSPTATPKGVRATSTSPSLSATSSPTPPCGSAQATSYIQRLAPEVNTLVEHFTNLEYPSLHSPPDEMGTISDRAASLVNQPFPACADGPREAAVALAEAILAASERIAVGGISYAEAEKDIPGLRSSYIAAVSDLRAGLNGSRSPALEPATIGVLQGRGLGWIRCASFSLDGTILAVGGYPGLYLIDAASEESIGFLDLKGQCMRSSFSPGRQFILFAPLDAPPYADYPLYIWDTSQARPIRALGPKPGEAQAPTFDLDSTQIATLEAGKVSFYRLEDLPLLVEGTMPADQMDPTPFVQIPLPIQTHWEDDALAYSSHLAIAAVAASDGRLGVVRTSGAPNGTSFQSPPTVYEYYLSSPGPAVAISEGTGAVAWGSHTAQLSVLNAPRDRLEHLGGPLLSTYSLMFTNSGRNLLSGALGEVVIWDVQSGIEKCRLRAGFNPIIGISIAPDGAAIYAVSNNSELFTWEIPPACLQ